MVGEDEGFRGMFLRKVVVLIDYFMGFEVVEKRFSLGMN